MIIMLHFFTEQNLEYNETKHELQEFVDLSKIAFLFSTTANAVSNILFTWALWVLLIKHCNYCSINKCIQRIWGRCKNSCCGIPLGEIDETLPLDPFNDESAEYLPLYDIKKSYKKLIEKSGKIFGKEDDCTNTPLQGERLCHYIVWFIIGLLILITTIVVFFTYQYHDAKNDNPMDYDDDFKMYFGLQISTLILHAYALFRSLVSCFIFSKLMYGIQNRCEELELFVYHVHKIYPRRSVAPSGRQETNNQPDYDMYVIRYLSQYKGQDEMTNLASDANIKDSNAKKYLKKRDKHFVKKALATLSWLQLWFLLHWLLHIISTFMVMTVLVDAVTLHVKARIPHLEPGVDFHPGEIGFLFMYSLLQCFFLFYPCLRAASVTRTRQRVIREISKKAKDKYSNIPPEVLNEFIESMKRHRFSFRLRILCARIPFNMNIAYLSIAFGFVGVVVSLITSVTN